MPSTDPATLASPNFPPALPSSPAVIELREASFRQRIQAAAIEDHHGRTLALDATGPAQLGEKIYCAVEGDRVTGWMRTAQEGLMLVRGNDFAESFHHGAVLELPVTSCCDVSVWRPLVERALCDLAAGGASQAYIYVPLDAQAATSLLAEQGFETVGFCDSLSTIERFGYRTRCRLMTRYLDAPRRRPSVLPRLIHGPTRSHANAADAPEPSLDFWDQTVLYSSFSGYAHTPDFLRAVLRPSDRSLLSAPCAAGDFLRLAPGGWVPRRVGLDLSERACRLATTRLACPHLDELNARLLRIFRQQTVRARDIDHTRRELSLLLEVLAGEKVTVERVDNLCLDMMAAFERLVESPAIPDWAILLKILALFLRPDSPDVETALGHLAAMGPETGAFLAACGHRQVFPAAPEPGSVRVLSADLRQELDLGERFDVVLVWEAALMFVSHGLERPFLHNLVRHLEPAGRLVLTGIRADLGSHPRELMAAAEILEGWGLECNLTSQVVPAAAWLPHSPELILPILVAWNSSGADRPSHHLSGEIDE